MTIWTQEQMISEASGYQDALCTPDETASSFNPVEGMWEHVPSMDINKFASKYFKSPEEALSWLNEEIQMFDDEGMSWRSDDFRSMLRDGIKEEIIIGNSVDGMALWDGTHRLAAAFAKGHRCPAIIGTRKH